MQQQTRKHNTHNKAHTKTLSTVLGSAMFLLLTGTQAMADDSLPTGNPKAGAQIYENVCKGCHSVSIAPTLRSVIGRHIGSEASFPNYTDALKTKQELVWSEELLNTFLVAPTEFAPGTLMVQTIPDAQQRADIIEFLKIFRAK